jgi:hypothetical protein
MVIGIPELLKTLPKALMEEGVTETPIFPW